MEDFANFARLVEAIQLEESQQQVVTLRTSITRLEQDFRVKKTIPLIKISGRLTFQDGRGFPEEPIRFVPGDIFRHERAEVESDKDGNLK
jgi:hypothetical protein